MFDKWQWDLQEGASVYDYGMPAMR